MLIQPALSSKSSCDQPDYFIMDLLWKIEQEVVKLDTSDIDSSKKRRKVPERFPRVRYHSGFFKFSGKASISLFLRSISRLIYKAYESHSKLYISNEPKSWKKIITVHPTQHQYIYKPSFWQLNSWSYLTWVANYPFLLHVETQTNPIYDGASMTNLSINGAVRQQCNSDRCRSREGSLGLLEIPRNWTRNTFIFVVAFGEGVKRRFMNFILKLPQMKHIFWSNACSPTWHVTIKVIGNVSMM